MNNPANFFIDTSGTLSKKIQFFVQQKKYYGLLFIPLVFYNLFMMNKKIKLDYWLGARIFQMFFLSFYPLLKPIIENLKKELNSYDR